MQRLPSSFAVEVEGRGLRAQDEGARSVSIGSVPRSVYSHTITSAG